MTKIYVVIWKMADEVKAYADEALAKAKVDEINRGLYMAGHDTADYAYLKEVELITEKN